MGNTKTAKGVARMLIRGYSSLFKEQVVPNKLQELAELFEDMSCDRSVKGDENNDKWAETDADWFDELSDQLEEAAARISKEEDAVLTWELK